MFFGNDRTFYFNQIIQGEMPSATAVVTGNPEFPQIYGIVSFYKTIYGTLVVSEIYGLPTDNEKCGNHIFGQHIHEGYFCTGNPEDYFANAKGHYNPYECPHPAHAGDLPPLFGNNGYAYSVVLTDRFAVDEIIGRTVIIHEKADDFTTQPSGNSGKKIACGKIETM